MKKQQNTGSSKTDFIGMKRFWYFLLQKFVSCLLWLCHRSQNLCNRAVRKIEFVLGSLSSKIQLGGDLGIDPVSVKKKFLIASHSSYDNPFTTFGDTAAMKVVIKWMKEIDADFDTACLKEHGFDGLDITKVNPQNYHTLIFVCGPWGMDMKNLVQRQFPNIGIIGIDLSVEKNIAHGLDLLIPRDFDGEHNPDLALISRTDSRPLIGIAMVHNQPEYGDRQQHQLVHEQIERYLESEDVAWVALDTLWKDNKSGIPDTIAFENLICRLDAVITTRMHVLVFSIKQGIPVLAIDAISGGAKVSAQAMALDWPLILESDNVNKKTIKKAVDKCLSGEMKQSVLHSQKYALKQLEKIETRFKESIKNEISNHSKRQ